MKKCNVSLIISASLLAAGVAHADSLSNQLAGPMTEYKLYVINEVNSFVSDTKQFTDAVKAGEVEKAKALYAPARIHYERIEPVAELFADLDASMDAREDDYEHGANDPTFTGFHRIEKALWADQSTSGMGNYADKLYQDTQDLKKRLTGLAFQPSDVVDGAAGLIEEVAATKITGEEDRYSRTDLWDFQANIDGSKKIVELLRPLLIEKNSALVTKVEDNFNTVDMILAKYRSGNGFVSYEKLSDADRTALKSPVTVLAEDLSELRGVLGLN
jgi:iron uptake system component EfeO